MPNSRQLTLIKRTQKTVWAWIYLTFVMPVLLGIYIHTQHITDAQYYWEMSTSGAGWWEVADLSDAPYNWHMSAFKLIWSSLTSKKTPFEMWHQYLLKVAMQVCWWCTVQDFVQHIQLNTSSTVFT